MNLEQQVCSLDLAKRLKELGVKQESLFWWMQQNIGAYTLNAYWTYCARAQNEKVAIRPTEKYSILKALDVLVNSESSI